MQRVLVIGSCGAGKSVLSRRIGEITGLPVIHLDRHFWRSGWVEPTKDVWRDQVEKLLEGDRWIVDGNYGGTMDLRLAKCDAVIFLDFGRVVCTWRVIRRSLAYRGRTRPDIADGCPEQIKLPFIKWTWNYPTRSRPQVIERLERVKDRVKIIALKNKREVEAFISSLHSNGNRND